MGATADGATDRERPILGITLGDPAGIGPEITLKALADPAMYRIARPLAIGDARALARDLHLAPAALRLNPIARPAEGRFEPGTVDVLDLGDADPASFALGEVSATAGNAAFTAVRAAIERAVAGEIDAIVTAPLNKEAMNLAGHHYAGHTEILADLTHSRDVSMMLTSGQMRVLHVSTHVSLREAIERTKHDRIVKVLRLARTAVRALGIAEPRIGVAGLNPHAGEGGLFGDEEIREIIPAIATARAAGIDASGPIPGDTIFVRMGRGEFDAVIAMYHDQGHIPIKLMGFDSGVNVTIGLPIIRTSVDHGTAFDIAGRGIAKHGSMIDAIEVAVQMAHARTGAVTPATTG